MKICVIKASEQAAAILIKIIWWHVKERVRSTLYLVFPQLLTFVSYSFSDSDFTSKNLKDELMEYVFYQLDSEQYKN